MGFSDSLNDIVRSISSQSADIDEKIARLQRAKSEISTEQNRSLNEIRKIVEPELDEFWKGSRATQFDDLREEAHRTMKDIVNEDYDDYKWQIENIIKGLNIQKGALNIASGLAHEASQLMDKGEDAVDELSSKLDDLRKRVF
ncbi:DUF5082 family protein [Fictibacillus iocasae]|uniref:DUF5082 family protein n=1 Tax=Fictibacillus iocasae TaxID=2715437 RepID=A0ABW2NUI9_9BACL